MIWKRSHSRGRYVPESISARSLEHSVGLLARNACAFRFQAADDAHFVAACMRASSVKQDVSVSFAIRRERPSFLCFKTPSSPLGLLRRLRVVRTESGDNAVSVAGVVVVEGTVRVDVTEVRRIADGTEPPVAGRPTGTPPSCFTLDAYRLPCRASSRRR